MNRITDLGAFKIPSSTLSPFPSDGHLALSVGESRPNRFGTYERPRSAQRRMGRQLERDAQKRGPQGVCR